MFNNIIFIIMCFSQYYLIIIDFGIINNIFFDVKIVNIFYYLEQKKYFRSNIYIFLFIF